MRLPLLLASLLVVSGCGSSAPAAPAPGEPIAFGGGTVKMPPGEGWRVVERKPDLVTFERRLATPDHVLVAIAQLFPFEFADLEECRASLHRDSYVETATHRDPRGSVELVAGADPAFVRVRYAAREAGPSGDGHDWFAVTTEFRWFLRPGDNRGVMLSFGERRPESAMPADHAGQAGVFFSSFRPATARGER